MKRFNISAADLGLALLSFAIVSLFFTKVENRYGRHRIIFNGHGACLEDPNQLDDEAARRHGGRVKLYPVRIQWGTLVPPESKENPPAGISYFYMCYEHAKLWNKEIKR